MSMKKQKNILILSDGSLVFDFNLGILSSQSKISFCKIDNINSFLNKKKIVKSFEYSNLSKQSKKYFK